MIYKGKEYKVITREGAKIGDLVHITALDDNDCDIHEFITWIDDEYDIHFDHYLPDGSYFVYKGDTFKTYRYVKDVEEVEGTPVKFKSGDRVRLTEFELNGQINFGNFNGYVDGEKFDGDYKVKFDDGSFGFFPQSSLELIKSYTIGQLKACEDFKKMIDELKAIGPLRNDVGVTPTNAVPKKVLKSPLKKEQIIPLTNPKKEHELINQTSKNIKQTDTVNSPSHYNQTKIEAIDIIEDVTAGYQSNVKYHIGNAIKYLIRAPFKNNTVEDLKKAVWYVNRAIEKLEGEK